MQPQQILDSKKRVKPPGFDVAKDGRNCARCRFFDGRGTCTKYHYPVKPFNTCSAFAPRTGEQDQPGSPSAAPGVVHPPGAAPLVQVNVHPGSNGA